MARVAVFEGKEDDNRAVLRRWPHHRQTCSQPYPRGCPRHTLLNAMLDPMWGRLSSAEVARLQWRDLRTLCKRDDT